MSGNEILTSIKGHNSVANMRKMTLYNPNLDLINVNVYTQFGKILSIGSQDIERKRNLTSIKGCNSVANLRNLKLYDPNLDSINVNVHTKFG